MKKVKIYTLGCKVNQYDSGKLRSGLEISGASIVKNDADLVVINTCSVTKKAVLKSRQILSRAKKENPHAKIIFVGCGVKAYREEFSKLSDRLISEKADSEMVFNELLPDRKFQFDFHSPISSNDKARYFMTVQDGCEQFCSYCIVPYTRGKMQSRRVDDIMAEVEAAVAFGYKEIVISGIHLGLFGKEKGNKEGINLVNLLKKILDVKDVGRIRLSSIEVNEVTPELIDLIANNKKICPHLHIPLQSGTDKILKLMNRPYDTDAYKNKIIAIRKKIPLVSITADVIVGFPGETEADFEETFDFIKELGLSRLHVFSFSAHEKTKAFNLPDRVEARIVKLRSVKLTALNDELEKLYAHKVDCAKQTLLIESVVGDVVRGKTEFYLDKSVNIGFIKPNTVIKIGNIIDI